MVDIKDIEKGMNNIEVNLKIKKVFYNEIIGKKDKRKYDKYSLILEDDTGSIRFEVWNPKTEPLEGQFVNANMLKAEFDDYRDQVKLVEPRGKKPAGYIMKFLDENTGSNGGNSGNGGSGGKKDWIDKVKDGDAVGDEDYEITMDRTTSYTAGAGQCDKCGFYKTWDTRVKNPKTGSMMPAHITKEGHLVSGGQCPYWEAFRTNKTFDISNVKDGKKGAKDNKAGNNSGKDLKDDNTGNTGDTGSIVVNFDEERLFRVIDEAMEAKLDSLKENMNRGQRSLMAGIEVILASLKQLGIDDELDGNLSKVSKKLEELQSNINARLEKSDEDFDWITQMDEKMKGVD